MTSTPIAPVAPIAPPALPWLEAEAALCIWEEMMDRHRQADPADWAAPMLALWEDVGTAQMRTVAMALAAPVEAAWVSLGSDLQDTIGPFDWEFVPLALALVDWQAIRPWCYGPATAPIAFPPIVASLIALEFAWAGYQSDAKRAAGRLWGYPELVEEDPDEVRAAFEAGEDAAAFVKRLGEDRELHEPDPITAQDLARLYP